MKLICVLLLLYFQTSSVFSQNVVDAETFEDYQGKVTSHYDLISLIHNFLHHIHYTSLLNADDQLFSASDFDEFQLNESEEPLLDFLTTRSFSIKCLQDINYIKYTLQNLRNISNQWALKLLDSYGKPETGILEGNSKWYGNYLECLDVYAPPVANTSVGNFNGKYCTLTMTVQLPQNASLPLTTGVCIPDTCSALDIPLNFVTLLQMAKSIPMLNSNTSFINVTSFTCKERSKDLNAPAIAVICLISFFTLLVVIGSSVTAYEHYFVAKGPSNKLLVSERTEKSSVIINEEQTSENRNTDDVELLFSQDSNSSPYSVFFENCKPFFKCFCIFTNGSKLLNTDHTEGQLLSIHGIRFLSMSWVILGHTYVFSVPSLANIIQAIKETDNVAFQIVYQGFFSVDSFFVLSGFLLTYLFMQECSKNKGNISWTYFYIHRYLRLTPVYMIVLGISSTIYFYLGSGPIWPDTTVDPVCKDWWWTNLLYINNFFSMKHQCMGWSWYLANDMQFFIISPLFLITLWRWPKVGYSLLGIFLFASFCASFFISYYYDLDATLITDPRDYSEVQNAMAKANDYLEKLYMKPYTRIAPYLIGIIVGYLVFKAKAVNRPKMSRIALLGGWFIASAITLTCVYGLYHRHPSTLAASFYNGVSRAIFGAGLSWVIYVCLTDQGGVVNKILAFKMFIPLSRLTYSAYLIHPLFLTGYFLSSKAAITASQPTVVLLFFGFLLVTYSFALLVSLIFESPIIGLEKLIRNKFISK